MPDREIYPNYARANDFSFMYCEMAMQSFVLAKENFAVLEKGNFAIELIEYEDELFKNCVATVVFATMTLEAFFNDYAASCIGDAEFREGFDKLNLKAKFGLIARLILKVEYDKSKSYYSHLHSLNSTRNEYVHSKSSLAKIQTYSLEEFTKMKERFEADIETMEIPTLDKVEINSDFNKAKIAIKAIRDIAYFFDENDVNANALAKLFRVYTILEAPEMVQDYIKSVVKDFDIKPLK